MVTEAWFGVPLSVFFLSPESSCVVTAELDVRLERVRDMRDVAMSVVF